MNYRVVALMDLVGQLSYYLVAVSLAVLGRGFWAQVAGYWAWQVVLLVWSYRASGVRPRFVWSRRLLRAMLGYGLGYAVSTWVWQLRTLVNPLVVGRYLGPAGVGYVSLAIQFVTLLAFVKTVTWRMSIAALAKVQNDYARLRAALEEAMSLQVLALGPLLAGFALVAPWLLPLAFGSRWSSVLTVYPFIALGYLVNCVFSMHASILYLFKLNNRVTLFHGLHIVLFAGASMLLVPRLGLVGYGWSEVIVLVTYALLHVQLARIMPFAYRQTLPWLAGCVPPLFAVFVPLFWQPVLWLPLLVVALWPRQRRQLAEYLRYVRWKPAQEMKV